jgi:two-component system, cell cycle sensor histidine kinase and response regulator CckA
MTTSAPAPRLILAGLSEPEARAVERALCRGGIDPRCERVATVPELLDALNGGGRSDIVVTGEGLGEPLSVLGTLHQAGKRAHCFVLADDATEELAWRAIDYGARDVLSRAELWRLAPAIRREIRAGGRNGRGAGARDETARLRALVDSSVDAVLLLDDERSCTFASGAAAELLGTTEDISGRRLDDFVEPGLRRELARIWGEMLRRGRLQDETRIARPDGSAVDVELVLRARVQGGLHAAWMREIGERKRIEEALHRDQVLLRSTLEAATDGIVVVGEDGALVYSNSRFASMWDAPDTLLHGGDHDRLLDFMAERVEDSGAFLDRARSLRASFDESFDTLRLRDGREIERYSRPLIGDDGVAGRVWNFRDVTERRRLQQQFLQAQKMESLGRLAGGVAHDFNNLMTAIIGNAELDLMELPDADPLRPDLEEIRQTAERAANLAHQLLAFSRREIVEPRVLKLNDLVARTERMLRRLIGADVELTTVKSREAGRVKVDPGQFEQILINLAVNARDAMPEGGRMTIRTGAATLERDAGAYGGVAPGRYATLQVSDTGCGMSPEVKERLFEPFFTTKEAGQGTGLGLPTCYGIVNQAGGWIDVESEIGRGTKLTIYLPEAQEHAEPLPEADGSGYLPEGDETVLLVEDEDAVRRIGARVLRGLGYTVLEASDGQEALDLVASTDQRIDIVFTDIVMPRLGGGGLVERIQELRPEAKLLFTTGYTEDQVVRGSVAKRGVSLLHKPFSPGSLARRVREVLDRA